MESEKVRLSGFDLPSEETAKITESVGHYLKKIQESIEFDVLELNLKKSIKGKAFNHEIQARLRTKGKVLSADVADYNVFKAVSSALEKIKNGAEHLRRTARQ